MTGPRRVRIIGIGAGDPGHVTAEAAAALRSVDFFVVAEKRDDDPLVAARREVLAAHGAADVPIVTVRDPERDRDATSVRSREGYETAVVDWHAARAAVFEQALLDHEGDAGFLVWGDPAFYDSTIRIVERIVARGVLALEVDVIPGISALQVLAAKHRIVLHEIGQPIHVTTGRRLAEAVTQGQDNILVMLDGGLACADLVDAEQAGDERAGPDSKGVDSAGAAPAGADDPAAWSIWWGANLGTEHESLVAGELSAVVGEIRTRREVVKANAGWVMDTYLLRR